jgi:large subunit ribosomal protein L6
MSRIGKKSINIPDGVEMKISANVVSIKGPKGALEFAHHYEVKVALQDKTVSVTKTGGSKKAQAIWGTTAKLISNMINGVTTGFEKQLELNGVGLRMSVSGGKIMMALGFSHPVEMVIPEGLAVKIENNVMTISGIDKQKVGELAAVVRKLKPVEPYKGKGFRYVGEVVKLKEGKKATASS